MSRTGSNQLRIARVATKDFALVAAPGLLLALFGGVWKGANEALVNGYFAADFRPLAVATFRSEFDRNMGMAIGAAAIATLLLALLRRFQFRAGPALVAAMGAVIILVSVSIIYAETWRVADYRLLLGRPLPRALDRYLLAKVGVAIGGISLIGLWLSRPGSVRRGARDGPLGLRARFQSLGLAASALAMAVWAASHAVAPMVSDPASNPYPVIYIAWDSVRADFVSGYGHEHETTPHLDEFSRDAVLFEQTVSPSTWTRPAFTSIMTSVPFWKIGGLGSRGGARYHTLAELLKNRGYRTLGFAQNPNLDAQLGFRQGFDEYVHVYTSQEPELMNELVLPRISALQESEQPFFLFVHYQEPHWPYRNESVPGDPAPAAVLDTDAVSALMQRATAWDANAPEAAEQLDFLHRSYDADIRATDDALGQLLAALKHAGIWDRALIVINSDHGDEFYEHGDFGHAHANLHPELTFVPQVIKFPKSLEIPAMRVAALVETQDIVPTILGVLGIDAPQQIEGSNLLPLEHLERTPRVAISVFNEMLMLRSPRRSLLFDAASDREPRYFDRTGDPRELNPLAWNPDDPSLSRMREITASYVEEWLLRKNVDGAAAGEDGGLDPELRRQLRALGYIR